MSANYYLDRTASELFREDGARFEPWTWTWSARPGGGATGDGRHPCGPVEALRTIGASGAARRVPVGVIGPREATDAQERTAEAVGRELGALGLTVICGGRQGVMAAVSRGVRASGGLSVGLLPGGDWREANDDIILPIATGLGEARNMIIAKSCAALIAVGGSYGTLSEVAYGLHFGKPVLALEGGAEVEGVRHFTSVEAAIEALAICLLDGADVS